jgi:hypothetical protein
METNREHGSVVLQSDAFTALHEGTARLLTGQPNFSKGKEQA